MLLSLKQFDVEDKNICKECGGSCCKTQPGIVHPNQLGNTYEQVRSNVKSMLKNGFCVDSWDPDAEFADRIYYIRPSMKGYEDRKYHAGWMETCVFHSNDGCSLDREKMPFQCLALVPNKDNLCQYPKESKASKREIVQSWKNFLKVFQNLIPEIK